MRAASRTPKGTRKTTHPKSGYEIIITLYDEEKVNEELKENNIRATKVTRMIYTVKIETW